MKTCDCWKFVHEFKQICLGTKEMEECNCNGDETKCTHYPEKRNKNKVLKTPEMWLQAQIDGKYYTTVHSQNEKIIYNKNTGLLYKKDKSLCTPGEYWYTFDSLMQELWTCNDNYMTKQEAEKKFGIKIIDE